MKKRLIVTLVLILHGLQFASAREIDAASVDDLSQQKSFENLQALVEIVNSNEIKKELRGYAFFKIKDLYIPENAIATWLGRDHITWEDMVEYIRTRTDEEMRSWLVVRPRLLAGFGTENYIVEVYDSDLEALDGKPLLEMTASEILITMKAALSNRHEAFKIKKFDFKKMFTGQWVVFGFFEDENGVDRLLALLDSNKVIFDHRK